MKVLHQVGVAFILLFLVINTTTVAASQDSLKIVNWNLEFFGDYPSQNKKEMSGILNIMKNLDADIYALVEVVNVDSLFSLTHQMNGNYQAIVSPFGSFASSPSSKDYDAAQKLAFIYRTSKVRNVVGRPFLKNSVGNAYYNWASGRYPYFVTAEVKDNFNNWQPINFIVVHAKAKNDNQSCMRRYEGGLEMKDSLDKLYPNDKLMILGDFNDDFDLSICGGPSNYEYLVSDSFGTNYYFSPTLSLSRQGDASIDGYPSFIDHIVLSNEMINDYVPGTAKLLKNEVNSWVSNYNANISDHFPVMATYVLSHPTTLPNFTSEPNSSIQLYPNPASNSIQLQLPENTLVHYELYNTLQQRVQTGTLSTSNNSIALPHLPDGLYFIRLIGTQTVVKEFFIHH